MSLRSLFGGIVGDAPVPLAPRWAGRGTLSTGGLFGAGRDRLNDLEAVTVLPALYGVVRKLSEMTSLVEWQLARKPREDGGEHEPLTGRAAERAAPLMVLNRPNRFTDRPSLFKASQQYKDLSGEFWWVVTRAGRLPVELWPVRPDRMFPVPHPTKFIAGYVYRSPDGEEVPLGVDDVLTSMLPDPRDPYRGLSPIAALAKDLAQADAQAEWNAALYRNSAQPGGIIKVGAKLTDDQWDELVERWRFQHQGVSNAGRVAVLEGENADFVPLAHTQKDMQFVETRNFTRQSVLDAYGFPKFGLGDVDDVNRATAEASLALMAQTLTVPRLEDFKALLNTRFLPMFGDVWRDYEFIYSDPVPPDAASERDDLTARTTSFATLIAAGADAAQASEVCGLPPLTITRQEVTPDGANQGPGGTEAR